MALNVQLNLLMKFTKVNTKSMEQKQHMEGILEGCEGHDCLDSCCDDAQIEERTNEYLVFHKKLKDHLISHGVSIDFLNDRVRFSNCSDGKTCKFLKHSPNKGIDPRPLDCKIFPFVVDWDSVDFNKKSINLYSSDKSCPLVKNNAIPNDFKREVEVIIKRDMAVLFSNHEFKVNFMTTANKNLDN